MGDAPNVATATLTIVAFRRKATGKHYLIPFHEKPDTDVNPESFTASQFFNCVSVAGRSRSVSKRSPLR
ncbi:MAG TPA: hypothetical protein IGS40_26265 [Trichormus sp. M33_DOE_039]|nr:hypothetical protein [Trichormus sp. M33_DOE_039]